MGIKFIDGTPDSNDMGSPIEVVDHIDEVTVLSALLKRGVFPDLDSALMTLVAERITGLGIPHGEAILYPTVALLARNNDPPEGDNALMSIYEQLQKETRSAARAALGLRLGDQAMFCAGRFDLRGLRRMGAGAMGDYVRNMVFMGYHAAQNGIAQVSPSARDITNITQPILGRYDDVVNILKSLSKPKDIARGPGLLA